MTVYVPFPFPLGMRRALWTPILLCPPIILKSLRIESLLRVVRRFVLAAVILPTFTAVPALLADTAPSFTSANSVTFPQGIRTNFTITTTGIPVPKITSSGHLPGGVKFVDNGDGTATLSGRPGGGNGLLGDYALTFTASNGVSPAGTQNFTLTITRPPRITSVNNATFVVGTANTFTITTRSTVPKTTLSYTGSLPGGVTFVPHNNGTATLSGTPAAGSQGIYFLTITGTNGTPPDAVQLFTLTVQDTRAGNACPNHHERGEHHFYRRHRRHLYYSYNWNAHFIDHSHWHAAGLAYIRR